MLYNKLDLQKFAVTTIEAGALIPDDEVQAIFESMADSSVIMQLGRRLPDMAHSQTKLNILSSLPIAHFVDGEIGTKGLTDMKWKNKYIIAEEIACIIPISEKALEDAGRDLFGEIRPAIGREFGRVFDNAVITGELAPTTWRKDLLTTAIDSGSVVVEGTGTDLYDDLLGEDGVISQVEKSGFFPTGHIASVGMKAKYRGLRGTDGHPIFTNTPQQATVYALDGEICHFPKNNILQSKDILQVTADFSELVWSLRKEISYKVLDQAVLQDNTGAIVYNLAQQDMVALRCVMRIGWEIPNPTNMIEEDETKRSIVAVLKKAP